MDCLQRTGNGYVMEGDNMSLPEDIGSIHPQERDVALDLHSENWGNGLRDRGWSVTPTAAPTEYVSRIITPKKDTNGETVYVRRQSQSSPDPERDLFESIVRFPSAPIYGIHRKHEYLYTLDRINYHTMRLLRRPSSDQAKPAKPAERVYLFHNGLNEINRFSFYYWLADLLLHDERSACILRPFPGHLTRCPFPEEYAEKPLDRYLADAGDLFRQFLRFMTETQWLLSALVPIPSYRVVAGLDLLADNHTLDASRANSSVLARHIHEAWQLASAASRKAARGVTIKPGHIKKSVETIRHLVGWEPTRTKKNDPFPDSVLPPPALHAIGYSLGGYLAQSVFFTWPFAVSSCTTIGSGGPLREVALTAFAHPEEWQTVMYALRFEIESAMLQRRIVRSQRKNGGYAIAGINEDHYAFFDRIFNEVFLQDFRGPYRQRVSEYVSRLLFVLGGKDPVISTQSVLESSPPEGINMMQIANLAHFPWSKEREWRDFWLPQIASVVAAFSHHTEDIHAKALTSNWGWWMNGQR